MVLFTIELFFCQLQVRMPVTNCPLHLRRTGRQQSYAVVQHLISVAAFFGILTTTGLTVSASVLS